jgi:SMC interacting uncharacterized protein involved in chromosome segregation
MLPTSVPPASINGHSRSRNWRRATAPLVTASNEREQVSRPLLRSTVVGGTTGTATCDARSHALSELPDWRSTDVS